MKLGEELSIFSQIINFIIFIYFSITLIKINSLDVISLFISAFGLVSSLIAQIVSVIKQSHSQN